MNLLSILFSLKENNGVIAWLKNHLLACPIKKFTGIDCPGCGLQRSFLALVQGDFSNSLRLYPATIPLLGLFIVTLLHLKFDFKNGAFFIKLLYIAVTFIIVVNYIYKIVNHKLI